MGTLTTSQAETDIQNFYKTYVPTYVAKVPSVLTDSVKLFGMAMDQGYSVKAAYDLVIGQAVTLAAAFEHAYPSIAQPTPSQMVDSVGFANKLPGSEVINYFYPNASAADKSAILSAMNSGSLSITQFASGFSIAKATNSSPSTADIIKANTSLTPGSVLKDSGLNFSGVSHDQLDSVTSMYIGGFGRAPDFSGLEFWAKEYAANMNSGHTQFDSLLMVGHNMYVAGTKNGEGGTGLDNASFVNNAYNNALGRAADASGSIYWINNLNSGTVERSQFLATFLTGAQNSERDATFLGARVGVSEFAAQKHVTGPGTPGVDLKALIAPVVDIPTAQTAIEGIISKYGVAPIEMAGISTLDASVYG